jgi:hypothetical protein
MFLASYIVVDESGLDKNLDRLMTRRAFLVDLDVGADVAIPTGLLYQSCPWTVLREDNLGVSTVISVSEEATHVLLRSRPK